MQDERRRAAAVAQIFKFEEDAMKRLTTFALCFAFIFVFGIAAQAQSPIRAHVPFAFTVGDTQFPAGDYQIFEHGSMLRVIHANGAAKTVVASFGTERGKNEQGTLQFVARDGKHYLAKVYAPGMQTGRELPIKN
jgi:hypothetical protein